MADTYPPTSVNVKLNRPSRHPPTDLYKVKVISLGSLAVGKTCLIKRFCEDRVSPKYLNTLSDEPTVRNEVRKYYWDRLRCKTSKHTR
jgi:GTPase SAR1 family protein